MFIILVSEDMITESDDVGSINIHSLPFEIDGTSTLIPSSLIMYDSNTVIDGTCQLVSSNFF